MKIIDVVVAVFISVLLFLSIAQHCSVVREIRYRTLNLEYNNFCLLQRSILTKENLDEFYENGDW